MVASFRQAERMRCTGRAMVRSLAKLNMFRRLIEIAGAAGATLVVTASAASATPCAFEPQGEGRVTAIIDGRSFRLQDGRELRLAGIEPAFPEQSAGKPARALTALLAGRDVRLSGEDDTPDRYGRQLAFVWLLPDETLVQRELLALGEAIASTDVSDKDCAASLLGAEATAREAKRGIWADATAIKHRKSGRYFGWDWALYAGRGQGVVRPASGGNHLSEFWTKLDTGLCCDYSTAGARQFGGRRLCT